ncbi:hypothetical protein H0E86_01590 [Streptomyces sp. SCSIO-PteL053]|nr:hypothetical protein H0E86_01590 [Streptomyces sp. SCSIO-PteL053]
MRGSDAPQSIGDHGLGNVDEHFHADLLVCVAEGFVTCVSPGQQRYGQLWIVAVRGGLPRLVAVLMLTAC